MADCSPKPVGRYIGQAALGVLHHAEAWGCWQPADVTHAVYAVHAELEGSCIGAEGYQQGPSADDICAGHAVHAELAGHAEGAHTFELWRVSQQQQQQEEQQ